MGQLALSLSAMDRQHGGGSGMNGVSNNTATVPQQGTYVRFPGDPSTTTTTAASSAASSSSGMDNNNQQQQQHQAWLDSKPSAVPTGIPDPPSYNMPNNINTPNVASVA